MDSCREKNLQIKIYKPTDCESSNKKYELLFETINYSLDKERNLILKNLEPSQIAYGTNYLINSFILNEKNDEYEMRKTNLTTSKSFLNFLLNNLKIILSSKIFR